MESIYFYGACFLASWAIVYVWITANPERMSIFDKYFFPMFKDIDGTFSWKKALTAMTGTTFSTGYIGYIFIPWVREAPAAYTAIVAGVFAAYFVNGVFKGLNITTKPESTEPK